MRAPRTRRAAKEKADQESRSGHPKQIGRTIIHVVLVASVIVWTALLVVTPKAWFLDRGDYNSSGALVVRAEALVRCVWVAAGANVKDVSVRRPLVGRVHTQPLRSPYEDRSDALAESSSMTSWNRSPLHACCTERARQNPVAPTGFEPVLPP